MNLAPIIEAWVNRRKIPITREEVLELCNDLEGTIKEAVVFQTTTEIAIISEYRRRFAKINDFLLRLNDVAGEINTILNER